MNAHKPPMELKEGAERMNTHFAHMLQAVAEDLSGLSAAGGDPAEHAAAFLTEARALETQLCAMRDAHQHVNTAAETATGVCAAGAVNGAPDPALAESEGLREEIRALQAELQDKNALITKSARQAAQWQTQLQQSARA